MTATSLLEEQAIFSNEKQQQCQFEYQWRHISGGSKSSQSLIHLDFAMQLTKSKHAATRSLLRP